MVAVNCFLKENVTYEQSSSNQTTNTKQSTFVLSNDDNSDNKSSPKVIWKSAPPPLKASVPNHDLYPKANPYTTYPTSLTITTW